MMEKVDIIKWLKDKGFPFEMECAQNFKDVGFTVQPSLHYKDLETNKIREIDFCAFRQISIGDFMFNVSFIVECKDSNTPWVGLTNKNSFEPIDFTSNIHSTKNCSKLKEEFANKELESFTYNVGKEEYLIHNLQQIRTKNNSKDSAYEGIQQALSACDYLKAKANNSNLKFANIYIPVVVQSNKLYAVQAEDNINEDNLTEKEYMKFVRVNAFSENPLSIVHIVSGLHLKSYCEKIIEEFHNMCENLSSEIKRISKESPTNSSKGEYTISSI